MGTPSWQNIRNTRYETTGHVSYVEPKGALVIHWDYFNRKQKC